MDLIGISNVRVVIEASDYYNEEDSGVVRTLRNSINFIKGRIRRFIPNGKRNNISFLKTIKSTFREQRFCYEKYFLYMSNISL